ncbi:MAG: hypothetical protein OHK0046_38960 [Anaerolineae bacterium]
MVIYITEEDVQAALSALRSPTDSASIEALKALVLVDLHLAERGLPLTDPKSREIAVFDLLTNLITDHFAKQRRLYDLDARLEYETLAEYIAGIHADDRTQVPDLIHWSLLYHLYVRVDLNLDTKAFADIIGTHIRTVQRYRELAVERLTRMLYDAEVDAQIYWRKQRMYSGLPPMPLVFEGRGAEIAKLREVLAQQPATVVIRGIAGTGKTAFVRAFLQELMREDPLLDHIVWINKPQDTQQVLATIGTQLGLPSQYDAVALTLYRCIVVLDDAKHIRDDLLRMLVSVPVLITTRDSIPSTLVNYTVTLGNLNAEDTTALIRRILSQYSDADGLVGDVAAIAHQSAGNPGLIWQLIAQFSQDHETDSGHWGRYLYDPAFQELNGQELSAWLSFALCPPRYISLQDIRLVWPDTDKYVLGSLVKRRLLQVSEDDRHEYALPVSALDFIGWLADSRSAPHVQVAIDRQLAVFEANMKQGVFLAVEIIEHLRSLTWLPLPQDKLDAWLFLLLHNHHHEHDPQTMLRLMSQVAQTRDFDGRLQQAVFLRRMGRWQETNTILLHLIQEAGRQGSFLDQARARLELSILLRYQGKYAEAVSLIDKVYQMAVRWQSQSLLDHTRMEYAQIYVDLQQGNEALAELREIAFVDLKSSLRYFSLLSEANLLMARFDEMHTAAQRALDLAHGNRHSTGKLHDLLGRGCLAQQQYDAAHHHFMIAMACFDTERDLFSLARTYTNTAVSYLEQHAYLKAEYLLDQAAGIQAKLGDTLGIAITHRNRAFLRRMAK